MWHKQIHVRHRRTYRITGHTWVKIWQTLKRLLDVWYENVQCPTYLIISQRGKSTITQQIDLTERICHRIYSHKAINWNLAFYLKPEWCDSNGLQTKISGTPTDKYASPTLMTIWDYNTHIGHADLEEGVMNCYLILCQTRRWTKKPFFHFSGTTFPNIFPISTAWVTKMTHRDFGL